MPRPEKVEQVQRLREALSEASNFYLVEFIGLSVPEMNQLRAAVAEATGRLQVVKNTLLRRALQELGIDGELESCLVGPTAVLYCAEDPVEPARAIVEFAKEHEGVRLKAGYVEGRTVDAAEAERIAKLPSKMETQAAIVGAIGGPLTEIVGLMNAVVSELVYVLQAVEDKRREEGEG